MTDNQIIPAPSSTPAPWIAEIDRDPALREKSKESYARTLGYFYEWKSERQITKTLVEEYCAHLHKSRKSPATIKHFLAVIKWWTRRAVDLAYEHYDTTRANDIALQANRILAIKEKSVAKGKRLPTGRHIPVEELSALIAACQADPSPAGARDAAWLAVAIPTGARIAEMLALTLDDLQYTATGADVIIQHGKGDKARKVFLSGPSLDAMNAWLNQRLDAPGALFCPVLKNGKVDTRQMTYEGARLILKKRFEQSKLSAAISWHDFRRTLAGNLFSMGLDGATIQEQMGHASITTTQRYDRRPEEARRIAISNIQVPYVKK